jgi:sugar phosphate isomerase/epimerase
MRKIPLKIKILMKHLSIFIAAILFAMACKQEEKPLLPDPGVVSYTFRAQFSEDFEGTLDLILGMGITNIEFSNLFGKTAPEIRKMLDERGMVCTTLGVGYDALLNNLEQVISDAKTLGAKNVRLGSLPRPGGVFDKELVESAAENFNRIGKALDDQGLHFSYHNHAFEFVPHGDATLYHYLIEITDPRYVSFEIDTYWVMHAGYDPVELLETYPDRFRLLHLKDLKKGVEGHYQLPSNSEHDVVLGTGQVDWPAVLRAAQNTKIEYFYIEDETDGVVKRVPLSREYIIGLKAGIKPYPGVLPDNTDTRELTSYCFAGFLVPLILFFGCLIISLAGNHSVGSGFPIKTTEQSFRAQAAFWF